MVDTLGLVIGVVVHTANIGERAGAKLLLKSLKTPLMRLKKILVDAGYSGPEMTDWVKDNFNWLWEVSKRPDKQKGFVVESKRWVVERTFAWLSQCRRLSKDHEFYEKSSESFIYLALIRKMLRDLTPMTS
jgi:putative transposase